MFQLAGAKVASRPLSFWQEHISYYCVTWKVPLSFFCSVSAPLALLLLLQTTTFALLSARLRPLRSLPHLWLHAVEFVFY